MVIDGKKIAQDIIAEIAKTELKTQPLFVDVLVGNDPVSRSYVDIKHRLAAKCGFAFECLELPHTVTTDQVIAAIHEKQKAKNLCGLIVQLPLPGHLHTNDILNSIDKRFDVDALGKDQESLFYAGTPIYIPPTAAAILKIFETLPKTLKQGKIVIAGYGRLVGKPVAYILKQRGYELQVADKSTPDLKAVTKQADVLICGLGVPKIIKADFVKPGSAIIDAGTSEDEGTIVGDVDFVSVSQIAGYITPTPGGVGPVTVACLLHNVLKASHEFIL